MKKQRLLELDALRGLAVLSVVLYHYFTRYNQTYGHESLNVDWSYYGQFGVELFFIISGFVIFWTLNRVDNPLDFIISRFSRLYPAYWCAIFVTFAVVFFYGLPGRETSLNDALMNVFMFHEYFRIPHVDGVYWSLTVELTFYFWIFLLFLTKSLNKVEFIFSLVIIISVLHSLEFISVPAPIYKIFIMKYLPFFMAGICFYKLVNRTDNIKITMATLVLSLLSTIVIFSFKSFILFSGFYIVFYMAVSGRLRFIAFGPFVFMGSISYSLYLLHQNIGYVIINKSYELNLNPLVGISIALFSSIALATIFVSYIENPSLTYIRRSYKHNEKIQRIAQKLTFFGKR